MSDPNEVVGHKTFDTGQIGPDGFPVLRHEPVSRSEAESLLTEIEARERKRAEQMPTDQDALRVMADAFRRLQELGWQEARYCPKDGQTFEVIEAGSTGIHKCHYSGEWPTGTFWIEDSGDLWPSDPILFRRIAEPKP